METACDGEGRKGGVGYGQNRLARAFRRRSSAWGTSGWAARRGGRPRRGREPSRNTPRPLGVPCFSPRRSDRARGETDAPRDSDEPIARAARSRIRGVHAPSSRSRWTEKRERGRRPAWERGAEWHGMRRAAGRGMSEPRVRGFVPGGNSGIVLSFDSRGIVKMCRLSLPRERFIARHRGVVFVPPRHISRPSPDPTGAPSLTYSSTTRHTT